MKLISSVSELIEWCAAIETRFNTVSKVSEAIRDGILHDNYIHWGLSFRAWGPYRDKESGEWRCLVNLLESYQDSLVCCLDNVKVLDEIGKSLGWRCEETKVTTFFTSQKLKTMRGSKFDYHTYIVRATGTNLIKIGKAVDTRKRIKQLQTGCPHKLKLIAELHEDLELTLHRRLAQYRVSGEWFDLPPEAKVAFMRELVNLVIL